jgi:1,4-dihydroxy-2-naphthoate octaprenyltransferase
MHSELAPSTRVMSIRNPDTAIKVHLGQLRLYSYSDLVLLLLAVGAHGRELAQCSLLWFGFLVFLDCQHRDRGRVPWPDIVWIGLWVVGLAIAPSLLVAPFLALAVLYTLKKRVRRLALISPLLNGSLKGALVCLVPGVALWQVVTVACLTGLRNVAGDYRDVLKDRADGVATSPIRLGARDDIRWLYPAALAATSVVWTVIGGLPWWYLLLALLVQVGTYRWTPR